MLPHDIRATSRRRFLQYCAASPLLAASGFAARALEAPSKLPDPMMWAPPGSLEPIKSPKEAINVFDFEPVCRANVPPAHFGYMASGIDDEVTLRANREDFKKFQLMPHRLNDVSKIDTSIELFGVKYDTPIFVCPTGANQFFHPDGELAVSRAAKVGNHMQMLSTSSNFSVDDVAKARGAPVWFQLYASPSFEVAKALIKRADGAGCPVLAVTVDRVAGRNQETLFRLMKSDTRECSGCHDRSSFASRALRRHNYDGIDLTGITWYERPEELAEKADIDVFVELIGGAEGAANVAVRAARIPRDEVLLLIRGRQDDDGLELGLGRRADALEHLVPVELGELQVEEDHGREVVRVAALEFPAAEEVVERLLPVVRDHDVVGDAVLLQRHQDQRLVVGVVLDDQDGLVLGFHLDSPVVK